MSKTCQSTLPPCSGFFPGYLFVKADTEQDGIFNLAWIPGASSLVCFDGQQEFGLTVANFQPRLSHVLLPGHTPGELVSLTSQDYSWLDNHEMIPFV